jgi:tricorn protease
MRCPTLLSIVTLLVFGLPVRGEIPLTLVQNPALAPDGKTLAFDWNGDVWTVPTAGGVAQPLTRHPGRDREPKFSPDGRQIAFISDRTGSNQIYVIPATGGTPKQVTFHTGGYALQGWHPDGQRLVAHGARDHYWRRAERLLLVDLRERRADQVVFDDYGDNASVSPDGKKILFNREGAQWWRKGYHGSQAAQVWLFDTATGEFEKILASEWDARWPLWKPDGRGFYYVAAKGKITNLHEYDFASKNSKPLTTFTADSVVFPTLSRDGSTLVFRHLFDLYVLKPGAGGPPEKINIRLVGDHIPETTQRRVLTSATQVAFSADGLEVAFIAGGDLWVMDTELKEPKQVTNTPAEERDPVFAPNGDSIWFVSDHGGQTDVWKAQRGDAKRYWWEQKSFKTTRITDDTATESNLKFSPDGKKLAFIKGRGNLTIMDVEGGGTNVLVPSWNPPQYDWSPDGKWVVYAVEDNDFNRDVFIQPIDGSRPPYNVSRHPREDSSPVWSPDGKAIAFTSRRQGEEVDVYYVYLKPEDDETSSRDRTLAKAIEKMNKARKAAPAAPPKPGDAPAKRDADGEGPAEAAPPPAGKKPTVPDVAIDFDKLHQRLRRLTIPESTEANLFWSPDGKRLAFSAKVDGRTGLYAVELEGDLRPKLLTTEVGSQMKWLKGTNQIVMLLSGQPAAVTVSGTTPASTAATPATSAPGGRRPGGGTTAAAPTAANESSGSGGTVTSYRFQAHQKVETPAKHAAAFEQAWRTMRDHYYDERLGNNDWEAIKKKYLDAAREAPDVDGLAVVVNLMLGELNGSHLGFMPLSSERARGRAPATPTPTPTPAPNEPTPTQWTETTGHLGARFDPTFKGPGWKIRDVIPGSPADQKKTKLMAGEIVLQINGKTLDPKMDPAEVLTLPPGAEAEVVVQGTDGKERTVTIRPIAYAAARTLLYDQWLEDNRQAVAKASDGKLGYLHISAMSMPTFHKFQEELFAQGAGKEGLIIDVRENGGGSTADHLLTALTQPVHAITIPRGGGRGYPSDRMVYATWNKPIVVMCNQNSFSNAEIFSHAIKTLQRGKLVGVPTAGGVISTGGTNIMDVGFLRLPGRGWYLLNDGEDMELNGAVPDVVIWPQPGELPRGKDVQLAKAVEVLTKEVEAWKQRPQPKLRKASERGAND